MPPAPVPSGMLRSLSLAPGGLVVALADVAVGAALFGSPAAVLGAMLVVAGALLLLGAAGEAALAAAARGRPERAT